MQYLCIKFNIKQQSNMSTTVSNFTITEILQDRQRVHDAASTAVKKQMCAKYGITSNKTKEIEKSILAVGLELHKQRTQFTVIEDIHCFNMYWKYPESSKKIREAFADESTEFVRYYLDYLRKQIALNPSRARWCERPIYYVDQILKERTTDNSVRDSLVLAISVQIKGFHDSYVKNHLDFAQWRFDTMKEKYGDIKSYRDVITKLHVTDKKAELLHKRISTFRVESHDFDREFYLERVRRDTEAEYLRCLTFVAERCLSAKMNTSRISVQSIDSNDAKAFDIWIKDDKNTMHARSIWCAEYSDFVTAHWRFIITKAN